MSAKIDADQVDLTGFATEVWVEGKRFLTAEADPWGVQSQEVTGTTVKTLKTTLRNGTIITATWNDLNTTYGSMTAQDLANDSAENKLISAVVLNAHIRSQVAAVYRPKGSVVNFSDLPTTGNQPGDVYNVEKSFVLDGKTVPAGTNVAYTDLGKWDPLGGFVDTSMFLTEETDPTGVKDIAVTGTTEKKITITLNNGTTKTASWTDIDTAYSAGTLTDLNAGTSTTAKLWTEKILNDWLNGKSFITIADVTTFLGTQKNELFTIVANQIASGIVSLNLTVPRKGTSLILAYYNGVKIAGNATSLNAAFNQLRITQASLATPIKVGKQVEVVYMG